MERGRLHKVSGIGIGIVLLSAISVTAYSGTGSEHQYQKLLIKFEDSNYSWEQVLNQETSVPRVFVKVFPGDFVEITQHDTRKRVFLQTLLPLILKVNHEIESKRNKLTEIYELYDKKKPLSSEQKRFLKNLAGDYEVNDPYDFKTLFRRVDVIPPSLALAQAAQETGWGASRFLQEGNALFGEWTWSGKGIQPKIHKGKGHKIKAFESLEDSIRSYARKLNTKGAYRTFRTERSAQRTQEALNGLALAKTLLHYSQQREKYVKSILSIIEKNDLAKIDQAQLEQD